MCQPYIESATAHSDDCHSPYLQMAAAILHCLIPMGDRHALSHTQASSAVFFFFVVVDVCFVFQASSTVVVCFFQQPLQKLTPFFNISADEISHGKSCPTYILEKQQHRSLISPKQPNVFFQNFFHITLCFFYHC